MRKYEQLENIHINTEPPRAHYFPYDTLQKALDGDKNSSAYYTDLNGEWGFRYFSRDIDCPDQIDRWDSIPVPSCWQNHGYEHPYYTNVNYPYPVDPPYVPDDNPVGVYRRVFDVTDEQAKSECYIVFEGVASCVELFVNGSYVGFSTVSHSTSEFKVKLKAGKNELIAKVYKWCVGSYLEDQDFFRYNGIFRDVYLLCRPEGHAKDISVRYDDKTIDCDLPYTVYDASGNVADLSHPILWNAEKPYLYTVVVEYNNEYIPFKVGMRSQSISEKGELLINGVSVKLKGVDHHDTHPLKGYTMSYEDMKNDLLRMKELNINCIRTSHYPPQPVFIELCDELGFYVVDEADNETHGFCCRFTNCGYDYSDIWPCSNPEWLGIHLDRAERLYQRDKNHTCVVMWSLGNETNYGSNSAAMCDYIREAQKDKPLKRLIHFREAQFGKDNEKIDAPTVDVVSRMYYTIEMYKEYYETSGDTRPYFLCEYAHAMGNGPGDVYEYWEHIYDDPRFIGGCIWEWTDHVAPNKNGDLCYGGDFGEETHDGNFCCDGLTFSDRSFKAGSYEAKAAYQPMKTTLSGNTVTVLNRLDFTNLNEYSFRYEITCDGNTVKEATFTLDAEPKQTASFTLPGVDCDCTFGTYVNVYMINANGYEVASEQHMLEAGKGICVPDALEATISLEDEYAVIRGDGFEHRFNTHYGRIDAIDGLTTSPLTLTVWRAPTDNDRNVKNSWYEYRLNATRTKLRSCEVSGNKITVKKALASISRQNLIYYTCVYTFGADGSIKVDLDCETDLPNGLFLPRLGFEFTTSEKEFAYFGYGPIESYRDMHHAAKLGMYESGAEKEYVDYIKPQEHGNHFGTRYLKLGDYEIIPENELEFNVSEYSSAELTEKAHNFELVKDGRTHVRLDCKVSGIGSNSCGPALKEKHRLNDKELHFSFTIRKLK